MWCLMMWCLIIIAVTLSYNYILHYMGSHNYYYQAPHPQTPHPWTPEIRTLRLLIRLQPMYGRFPKFHRVFCWGRDPGTLKSDIVSKKTSTTSLFGFETLKLKIRRLKLWKPTVRCFHRSIRRMGIWLQSSPTILSDDWLLCLRNILPERWYSMCMFESHRLCLNVWLLKWYTIKPPGGQTLRSPRPKVTSVLTQYVRDRLHDPFCNTYIYIYICIYIYIYIDVCIYIYIYMHTYNYIYKLCVFMYVGMCVCIYIYIYIYTDYDMFVFVCVCVFTCVRGMLDMN